MAPREPRTAKSARYPAAVGHMSDMQAILPNYATSLPSYPQYAMNQEVQARVGGTWVRAVIVKPAMYGSNNLVVSYEICYIDHRRKEHKITLDVRDISRL